MAGPARLALLAAVGLIASFLRIAPGAAQEWPTRPVTMVYPFGAGSSADVLGRAFASRLSELLGQPVVFENVAGAGGMTGSARVARAPPDGYQFVLGGTFMALNQSLYKNPLYNLATAFTPIILIVEQPALLMARKELPIGNLAEFIAYAKANEARMQYGSGGVGSAPHLTCALLNKAIGVNVTHVPYRGASGPVQDMLGGRIDYYCPLAALAIPLIHSKSVTPIAIFSKQRLPVLPELATAHEQGFDFEVVPWYAFFLPKGTPAPIVEKLREATIAAMATPGIREQLAALGYTIVEPDRRSPEYLQRLVESEIARWADVIKGAGISAD